MEDRFTKEPCIDRFLLISNFQGRCIANTVVDESSPRHHAQPHFHRASEKLFVNRKSVLISGAGIAGPTLAYWLLKRGYEPTLLERASHFRQGGYMIDFWGVGFDVAERMNLIPRLRDLGYFIDRVKFVNQTGRTRSVFDGAILRRALGNRFFSVPRGDLAKTIFDTIADKIEVVFGNHITFIHEEPTGVHVQFERGEARRFDLVAGCDGLHSAVRRIAWGPEREFENYLGYYCGSFLTTNYPHREERTYTSYAEPGRQISRYALRGNRTAFLLIFACQQPLEQDPDLTSAKTMLRERFRDYSWVESVEILKRLETCEDLYFDSVSQIRMPAWSKGRIVLVGDAAYCPSLLAGEGAGFALAGAHLLAGELQRANGDHVAAYRAYEQRFRAFIDKKQKSAAQFANSFTPKSQVGLFVRDLVLRFSAFSPVNDWLIRRFVSDRFELPSYPG
jgi:2-polyprenyl-6-methoxyphenol hydroxylase-like FAD-dependent oxidoreductase